MAKDGDKRLYTQRELNRAVREAVAAATAPLLSRIADLEAQIEKMRKDSSNSSKPPSSDVVKPPKGSKGKRKNRRGGQKGHKKHKRQDFPPDQVDKSYDYELNDTTGLEPLNDWRVVQQVELLEKPFIVTEHRARRYRCRRTGRIITAPLPEDLTRAGLLGPRLTTLACYLKGVCHGSYRTVHRFFDEVLGLDLSVGLLAKAVRKMTRALADSYQELIAALPRRPALSIDETGLRHCGEGHWVWCAHVPGPDGLTCFSIDPSRGSNVLKQILGSDYRGFIHCDFFSAYRKYLTDIEGVRMQFCWAHLIRDIKFMVGLSDKVTSNFGRRLLEVVRKMFSLIHRRAEMTRHGWQRSMKRFKDQIIGLIRRAPSRVEPQNLKKRFRDHGRSYFTFLDHEGLEPTNNAAERQIRFVVLDRKVTQGTKGKIGKLWCERIWSTVATCRQRGKSVYTFMLDALEASLSGKPAPSLIYA